MAGSLLNLARVALLICFLLSVSLFVWSVIEITTQVSAFPVASLVGHTFSALLLAFLYLNASCIFISQERNDLSVSA